MKNTRSSGDGLEAGDAVTAAQMRALGRDAPVATSAGTAPATLMSAANIEAATGWRCRSRSPTANLPGFALRCEADRRVQRARRTAR